MSKIYTKRGDQGETSLFGDRRVAKSHISIKAIGAIDELNAYLGLVRDRAVDRKIKDFIISIQESLFTIGSQISGVATAATNLPEHLGELERAIDQIEEELPPLNNFIIPGGQEVVSQIHIARSVCRRAERLVVELDSQTKIDSAVLQYLNRLSDYLFVLARLTAKRLKVEQKIWSN